ncbi:uncharacterized protein LOC144556814 isoform X2 [Carex rostrata]
MATTLELPIKRACEEIGSYSGLEASKKAKADTQSPEYSSFRTFGAFCNHYGDSLEDPLTAWTEYLEKLNEECKIEEIKLYLISKGQEDAAKKIQSFEDDLACSIESSPEFRNKGWILRTTPGPYNNYQRLYVGDVFYGNEDIPGDYCIFYNKYSADLAFLELFKELQSSIKWDTSASELKRTHDDASMRYNGILSSLFVETITGEIKFLKKAEQNAKEWVSLCTKFWHEVARSERDYMEVLIDIKKKDVASPSLYIKNGDNDRILHTLKKVIKYINSATKGEYSEEELIVRYFSRDGPLLVSLIPDTYADYLKEKIKIAKKLGLIK